MKIAAVLLASSLSLAIPVSALAQGSLPPGWVAKTVTVTGMKQGDVGTADVRCATGQAVTGGGYEMNQADRDLVVILTGPLVGAAPGWIVKFKNTGAVERNVSVDVYAGCSPAIVSEIRRSRVGQR